MRFLKNGLPRVVCGFQYPVVSSAVAGTVSSFQYAVALLRLQYAVGSEHCCEKTTNYNFRNFSSKLTSFTTKMLNCILPTANTRMVKQLPTFTTKVLNCIPPTANTRKAKQLLTAKLHIACCILITCTLSAQNVDIGSVGKGKALKISGGVSANSIFYNTSQSNSRESFTYFLQGNLNIGFYQFNMPISYSYSNQGSQLDYQVPFKFNRLSLHPKYKWIQAHIGDVSMSFSPYTLSGHQFTGGGLELTPKGDFKISVMGGRLLKATEDDDDARTIPAFSRLGYGAKLGLEKEKYSIGIIGFYAKDAIKSLVIVPDDKGITPKENLVLSIDGSYKFSKNLEFKGEYASTAITQDLRAVETSENGQGLAGLFFRNRGSTAYFTALKAAFDYRIGKSAVGIGYERIDPGYQTLGAYFFNNDFENITLNTSTALFKDKVNISFNIGYQRDDLEKQKEQATSRTVGAVNLNFTASEKLSVTASYSNFSTFTNAKVNQFDVINDDNLLDNVSDALDYKQLSQNANIGINYVISKEEDKQQKLSLNYALADVSNEQGGIVRIGDASTFHNVNTSYTIGFPKKNMNITAAINGTVNTIGREDATTWGPTVSVNKKFFDKKLNTGFAASYNTSEHQSGTTSITNFRANASYVYLEKHNFNLNAIQLFKALPSGNNQELTITFGYNYTFDLGMQKKKQRKKSAVEVKEPRVIKEKRIKEFEFSYRTHLFKGAHATISKEIFAIINTEKFTTMRQLKEVIVKLETLEARLMTLENENNKVYKKAAFGYLNELYKNKDFLDTYHRLAIKSLRKLYADAVSIGADVKEDYLALLAKHNTAEKNSIKISKKDIEKLQLKEKRYKAHKWMQAQIRVLTLKDVKENKGLLNDFKNKELINVFSMLNAGKTAQDVTQYLEIEFADFYHKKSFEIKNYELLD